MTPKPMLRFPHPTPFAVATVASLALAAPAFADSAPPPAPMLRFLGRTHAMVVHFPIALLFTAAACEFGAWIRHRRARRAATSDAGAHAGSPPAAGSHSESSTPPSAPYSPPIGASAVARVCLPLGALSAVAAAWFGWLNAEFEQAGNTETTLALHRWCGVALAVVACVCVVARMLWNRGGPRAGRVYGIGLALAAGLVSYTGHLGGALVYGGNYLFEVFGAPDSQKPVGDVPERQERRAAGTPTTTASTALGNVEAEIQAIFAARCIECHGPDSQKGGLRLDDIADASAPGGPIKPGDADGSELMERVTLPPSEKRFMPRKRDPLSADQIALIRRWINGLTPPPAPLDDPASESEPADETAAPAEQPADDMPPERASGSPSSAPSAAARPPRDAAPAAPSIDTAACDAAFARLRARGANAQLISADAAGVEVDFSLIGKSAGDADLALLAGLEATLERLNLNGTSVTDAGIAKLTPFVALRRVNLAHTRVTDAGLRAIAGLRRLEQLNGVDTPITDAGVAELVAAIPALKRVFAWGSGVTAAGVEAICARRPDVSIGLGAALPASQPAAPTVSPPASVSDVAGRKKPACCAAAEAKGELCDHACCVEARSKSEICPKCGG